MYAFLLSVCRSPVSFSDGKDPFVTSPGAWVRGGVSWAAEGRRETGTRFVPAPGELVLSGAWGLGCEWAGAPGLGLAVDLSGDRAEASRSEGCALSTGRGGILCDLAAAGPWPEAGACGVLSPLSRVNVRGGRRDVSLPCRRLSAAGKGTRRRGDAPRTHSHFCLICQNKAAQHSRPLADGCHVHTCHREGSVCPTFSLFANQS